MTILTTGLLALAAAGQAVLAQNNGTYNNNTSNNNVIDIDIPAGLAPRRLLPDVYGYSIEPIWVDAFVGTRKAARLLQAIAETVAVGEPAPGVGDDHTPVQQLWEETVDHLARNAGRAASRLEVECEGGG